MNNLFNKKGNLLRYTIEGLKVKGLENADLFHNTRYLLKNYLPVKKRLDLELQELDGKCQELVNQSLVHVLNMVSDIDPRIKTEWMRERLKSIEESKIIMDLINLSLNILRNRSGKGEFYYSLIYRCYIIELTTPIEDLAEEYYFSRATLFRQLNIAIEELSIILWGFFY